MSYEIFKTVSGDIRLSGLTEIDVYEAFDETPMQALRTYPVHLIQTVKTAGKKWRLTPLSFTINYILK